LLWLGVATLSVSAVAAEMAIRCWKSKSAWTLRLTRLAVGQFIPCLLAGAAVTTVLVLSARDSLWMLPGLWSIVFSLGVFASAPLLPRAIGLAAGYYLVSGVVCLLTGRADAAFSPWTMAGTFGVGQLLAALVLFRQLERSDETPRPF
ncbi:MAG: hypothetical protein ACREIV_13540, partial [Planctomycetaceae bacterium]